MFPDELEAAYAACPVVYFAYGLCEPHGPQNALGLDALKAHAICVEAAKVHGGIVAPPDYWHIHDVGGYGLWARQHVGEVERPWMTSVPPWHHFKNVLYHIRAAEFQRFKAAILLTGHYGPNWNDLKDMVALIQPHVGVRLASFPDFECNTPGFDGDGQSGGDHAGKVETSLLAALEPECVDITRLPEKTEGMGTPFAMGSNAHETDRRVGERMVRDEVRFLGERAAELLAAYDELRPEHTMRTFAQTERVWSEVVHPKLPEFMTLRDTWHGDEMPDDSVWAENWPIGEIPPG
jgi:creatinine amidohydrolase